MMNYTVIPGDTMWSIALMHGVELDTLKMANPQITNASLIYPGQVISIPGNSNTSTYIVKKTDTMWNIARRYGILLNKLMMANPQIKNSALIYPGQIINIPSSANIPSTPETPSVPSTPSAPTAPSDIRTLETEVVRLVNAERAKVGRSPLTENNEVSRIARIKSDDFIKNNYFAHNSPKYGSPFEMLESFGVNSRASAENIASGQRTAAEVMKTWMNSPGHRENILSSSYNQIGVGVARDSNGNLYWTQMFIRS